jgi:hypothetical protein
MRKLILIGLSLLIAPVSNRESSLASAETFQTEVRPINCEHNIARLDIAHDKAGNGLIILIARLGDGEFNQEFNRRRLHSARKYLSAYAVRAEEMIITAEGERVRGYGRVEIYVEGKLFDILAVRRNADLSVGSCEPQELDDPRQRELRKKLYPWDYQRSRKGGEWRTRKPNKALQLTAR